MDKKTLERIMGQKPKGIVKGTTTSSKSEPPRLDPNKVMRVPKAYWSAKFSDLEGVDEKIAEIKDAINEGKSITLVGCTGSGKTHLAVCLMKYRCFKAKMPVHEAPIFVSVPDLILEIKDSWDSDNWTERDIIEHYTRPTLVVFDDLGVGNITDWVRGVLYSLIDKRMREEKQTIVTSNFTPDEIAEKIDGRIASRLSGMGIYVELGDTDYRVKGK